MKKKLQINLNSTHNHIYYPGDLVTGTVKIASSLAKQQPDLILTLYGVAAVRFIKSSGRYRKVCTGKEKIPEICQEINTVAFETEYPFTFKIPKPTTALPWTTTSSKGKVEYGVEVKLNSTAKCFVLKYFESSVKTVFTLNSNVSKETINKRNKYYLKVHHENRNRKFGSGPFLLCCNTFFIPESIEVGLRLKEETGWYKQGDLVHFEVCIDNSQSSKYVENIKIRLIEIWSYTSDFTRDHYEKTIKYPWEFTTASVSPKSQVTTENTYRLPCTILPTQVELDVIKVAYKLQVYVRGISKRFCTCPVIVETDILIGSKQN